MAAESANKRQYLRETVYEAARRRIRWLFQHFDEVVVSISGGKDSTVIFWLTLDVAREVGRLPLSVLFLDQELEWESTIDVIRPIMYREDVQPYWLQMPFLLSNATSSSETWLRCWDPAAEDRWMRPKEPIAITINDLGQSRFRTMFDAFARSRWREKTMCYLTGMRAEESPNRWTALTHAACFKGETWGRRHAKNAEHYTMHPLYDWTWSDVWKAIADHNWPYNSLYDQMYQRGVSLRYMRVSALCHEISIQNSYNLQVFEPKTYERVVRRLAGMDAAMKLEQEGFGVREVPPMFSGWQEYRDWLLPKLIANEQWVALMQARFASHDALYGASPLAAQMWRTQVVEILTNDWEGVRTGNLKSKRVFVGYRKSLRAKTASPPHPSRAIGEVA